LLERRTPPDFCFADRAVVLLAPLRVAPVFATFFFVDFDVVDRCEEDRFTTFFFGDRVAAVVLLIFFFVAISMAPYWASSFGCAFPQAPC
jgi:hypothetical protein